MRWVPEILGVCLEGRLPLALSKYLLPIYQIKANNRDENVGAFGEMRYLCYQILGISSLIEGVIT